MFRVVGINFVADQLATNQRAATCYLCQHAIDQGSGWRYQVRRAKHTTVRYVHPECLEKTIRRSDYDWSNFLYPEVREVDYVPRNYRVSQDEVARMVDYFANPLAP
jgi:hypothetical protein